MRGVLVCSCGNRINVDLVREFTQVRCPKCGKVLDREESLEKKK